MSWKNIVDNEKLNLGILSLKSIENKKQYFFLKTEDLLEIQRAVAGGYLYENKIYQIYRLELCNVTIGVDQRAACSFFTQLFQVNGLRALDLVGDANNPPCLSCILLKALTQAVETTLNLNLLKINLRQERSSFESLAEMLRRNNSLEYFWCNINDADANFLVSAAALEKQNSKLRKLHLPETDFTGFDFQKIKPSSNLEIVGKGVKVEFGLNSDGTLFKGRKHQICGEDNPAVIRARNSMHLHD